MLDWQAWRLMLKSRQALLLARGFSLVELVIVLLLIAILLKMAVPSLYGWMIGAQVRTVAESLQNGLRLAQSEAVRRNHQVIFVLTNATPAQNAAPANPASNWYVQAIPQYNGEFTSASQSYIGGSPSTSPSAATQSKITAVTTPAYGSAAVSAVCFNSVGRLITNNSVSSFPNLPAACNAADTTMTINPPASSFDTTAIHAMQVSITQGGKIRMCDPRYTIAQQPFGC